MLTSISIAEVLLYYYPAILTFNFQNKWIEFNKTHLQDMIVLVLNFVLAAIMFKDMRKQGNFSIPILLLTLFSNIGGIIFFLFSQKQKPV